MVTRSGWGGPAETSHKAMVTSSGWGGPAEDPHLDPTNTRLEPSAGWMGLRLISGGKKR